MNTFGGQATVQATGNLMYANTFSDLVRIQFNLAQLYKKAMHKSLSGGAMALWFTLRTPYSEVRGSRPTRVAVLCP